MNSDDDHRVTSTRGYSDSTLLSHLRDVNEEYQRLPTISDLERYNEEKSPAITPHSQTYIARFGSWSDALEEAFHDAELCRELWRVANEVDRRPFLDDLEEHSRFDSRAYRRRFGSWKAALEAAEFDPSARIPDDFLIADLWRVAKVEQTYSETESEVHIPVFSALDEWWSLSIEKLQEEGKYSHQTYLRRLGGERGGTVGAEETVGLLKLP